MHFVPDRYAYLADIQRAMMPGGVLILTDKMASSPLTKELYFDFKRERGMTDEQIAAKEEAIKGVLNPDSLTMYLDYLKMLFRQVDVLDASYGFVSLMAIK